MSKHTEELMKLMEVTEVEDVEFEARMAAIDSQPNSNDPEDLKAFTPRERLATIFPISLIETMDDNEVAEQVAIIDEETVDTLKEDTNVTGTSDMSQGEQLPEQNVSTQVSA